MPGKNINSTAVGKVFNIKDYLEATSDASTRTRTVTIVLVIASVLIFIGFWNSFKSSWATERVRAAYDRNYNKYKMLTDETHLESDIDKKSYEENLRPQVLRAYIDNVRFIKLPFFGIAIEVNDLGTIGGFSLIIILLLLRFSLSREIKNLNISFKEAVHHRQLCEFYHALAMRQVLTVPEMTGEERNLLLTSASKIVYLLPGIVIGIGVIYDFYSSLLLELFDFSFVSFGHLFETIFLFGVLWLSWRCYERQRHIDHIWESYWNQIGKEKSNIVRIDKNIAEKFNDREEIFSALKTLYRFKRRFNRRFAPNAQKNKMIESVRDKLFSTNGRPKTYILHLGKNLVPDFGSDRETNEVLEMYLRDKEKKAKKKVQIHERSL